MPKCLLIAPRNVPLCGPKPLFQAAEVSASPSVPIFLNRTACKWSKHVSCLCSLHMLAPVLLPTKSLLYMSCFSWLAAWYGPVATEPTFNLSRMLPVVEGEAGAAVRAAALWGHAWLLASRQSAHAPTQQLAMDGRSSYNTCSSASR